MSKTQTILCVSFSRIDIGLFIFHLVVDSNINLLHNVQWIHISWMSIMRVGNLFSSIPPPSLFIYIYIYIYIYRERERERENFKMNRSANRFVIFKNFFSV